MEEQKLHKNSYSYTVRKTPVLLIAQIICIEILVLVAHLTIRAISVWIASILVLDIPSFVMTLEIIIMQVLGVYLIVMLVLQWINTYYILNPKEVIVRKGVISTYSGTYELANLQSMTVLQGVFGKIFNYGTIKLFNPVLKEDLYLSDISNPRKYAAIIQEIEPELTPIIRKQR